MRLGEERFNPGAEVMACRSPGSQASVLATLGGARAQPVTSRPELHDGVHSAILPRFGLPQQNIVGMCVLHTLTYMHRDGEKEEGQGEGPLLLTLSHDHRTMVILPWRI